MKILITGSNGLLGQCMVQALLQQTDWQVLGIGKGPCRLPLLNEQRFVYHDIDIADGAAAFSFYLQQRPDIIVHAAAMTQVDDCELRPVACWNVNVTATRFLVEAARKFNPHFIFVSTDFVFDGSAGPYSETDQPNPVSYYGSSKWAGEKEILRSGLSAAIVRTCLVYGTTHDGSRSNIVSWVKNSLLAGKPINVVNDQWRTPTLVNDLAMGILLIAQQRATGIFHISGNEMMSPYQMALRTAEHYQLNKKLITPVDASTFIQPAQRPPKTGFSIAKAQAQLGYRPHAFAEGLQIMDTPPGA
jgi:dTDP-4-dehydrorhamnose reductase